MKKYLLYTILSLFLYPVVAFSANLSGIVKFSDGKAVMDATIVIQKLKKQAITDENGRFYLQDIEYGKYQIDVLSLGIKNKSIEVDFNSRNKNVVLVVEPSNLQLDEVVISANSKKRSIEVKGFAVNVLETQKLATQSIQTNELLDRTAGVRIRQSGGLGSQAKYNINGLSGEAIKIFIDGVPAANYGASFSLNSIPPSFIERVEVYKGVVPGYLSEDALGGAINIVLKKNNRKSLMTSYSIGSFNTHQWNATGSYRWNNGLTLDGSAFYNYSDNDYKVWGNDVYFVSHDGSITESNGKKVKRFHDAYRSYGGKFNFGYTDVKWADKLLFGVVASKDYNEIQNGITMRNVYGDRHTRRKSFVTTLSYAKKDLFTKGLDFNMDASHSYLRRQVIDTVGIMYDWAGPIKKPDGSNATYIGGAEIGNMKTAGINRDYANMLRTNISYNFLENYYIHANHLFNAFQRRNSDKYQPAAQQKLKNSRDLQKNILAFTFEHRAFKDRLKTSIFYKHYFQKVTSNEPYKENDDYKIRVFNKKTNHSGYGITLSFEVLPSLFLLGSAEKAYRLPNADESFGNIADNLLPPSPALEPEKSFNVNLGANYSFSLGQNNFGLNAMVYFRDTQGMIREAIRSGSFTFSQFENLEDVLSRGIDAEFNYGYSDKLNFRFNISKFDVLFNTKYDQKGDPYQYYRMQIRNEPSFKFNSNIAYNFKNVFIKDSKLTIYYNVSYVKSFLRNWANVGSANLSKIPTQSPMDIGFSYSLLKNKLVFGFDVKNIMDKQIFDNFGLQKPGRAFYSKITYSIF